jgi:MFS family permease
MTALVERHKVLLQVSKDFLKGEYLGDGLDVKRATLAGGCFALAWWCASLALATVLRTDIVLFERLRVCLGLIVAAGVIASLHALLTRLYPGFKPPDSVLWILAGLAAVAAAGVATVPSPHPLLVVMLALFSAGGCLAGACLVDYHQTSAAGRYLEARAEEVFFLDREWRQAREVLARSAGRMRELQNGSFSERVALETSELELASRIAENHELGRCAARDTNG